MFWQLAASAKIVYCCDCFVEVWTVPNVLEYAVTWVKRIVLKAKSIWIWDIYIAYKTHTEKQTVYLLPGSHVLDHLDLSIAYLYMKFLKCLVEMWAVFLEQKWALDGLYYSDLQLNVSQDIPELFINFCPCAITRLKWLVSRLSSLGLVGRLKHVVGKRSLLCDARVTDVKKNKLTVLIRHVDTSESII